MIAVIFEVVPRSGLEDEYLAIAGKLLPDLQQVDGFISVERFRSLAVPDKLLSLSLWRDEEAVHRWRSAPLHREAQRQGRKRVFADYRLRVAAVVRDYGLEDREQAPEDAL